MLLPRPPLPLFHRAGFRIGRAHRMGSPLQSDGQSGQRRRRLGKLQAVGKRSRSGYPVLRLIMPMVRIRRCCLRADNTTSRTACSRSFACHLESFFPLGLGIAVMRPRIPTLRSGSRDSYLLICMPRIVALRRYSNVKSSGRPPPARPCAAPPSCPWSLPSPRTCHRSWRGYQAPPACC